MPLLVAIGTFSRRVEKDPQGGIKSCKQLNGLVINISFDIFVGCRNEMKGIEKDVEKSDRASVIQTLIARLLFVQTFMFR
jgi:hypothetical protein